MTARRITIAEIRQACAAHFGVTVADILGPSRKQVHFLPRAVAIFLALKITDKTASTLGKTYFGGRDHATIGHAYKRVLSDYDLIAEAAVILDGLLV